MRLKRKLSIEMMLYNILYLSYLIPASRVKPLVPDVLPLSTYNDRVFISIVVFHANIWFKGFPFLHLKHDQINLRTYVKDPLNGKHSVYFLLSGLSSVNAHFIRRFFNFPCVKASFSIKAEQNKDKLYLRYSVSGDWEGNFFIEAKEASSQIMNFRPFSSFDEALYFLTEPLIGFYGSSQKLYRFEVSHPHMMSELCQLLKINFPLLTFSGLIKEVEIHQPHSILFIPKGHFSVFLPPRLFKL